jgi:hypothetical protein
LRWRSLSSARNGRAMNVEAINIGPSHAITPVQAARPDGKGAPATATSTPEGAAPGEALTLLEAEVLESVGLTGA